MFLSAFILYNNVLYHFFYCVEYHLKIIRLLILDGDSVFVLTNFYLMIISGKFSLEIGLITLFITLWGGRLFLHILKRNWRKPEDFRYAAWRKSWGKWLILRSFFQIYMLQAVMMLIIMMPVISVYQIKTKPIGYLTGIGDNHLEYRLFL